MIQDRRLHIQPGQYSFSAEERVQFSKMEVIGQHLQNAIPNLQYVRLYQEHIKPKDLGLLLDRRVEPENYLYIPASKEGVCVKCTMGDRLTRGGISDLESIDSVEMGTITFVDVGQIGTNVIPKEDRLNAYDGILALSWNAPKYYDYNYRLHIGGKDPGLIISELSGFINDEIKSLGITPKKLI